MLTRKENNWITGIYFGFWFVAIAAVGFVIYGVFYNPMALISVVLVLGAIVAAIYGLYRFNNPRTPSTPASTSKEDQEK